MRPPCRRMQISRTPADATARNRKRHENSTETAHFAFCPRVLLTWVVGGGLSKVSLVAVIGADDSVAWAVEKVIRSAGLAVTVFASAEQFIRSDQVPSTACLVLDVLLPGMSGLQLQSHLASAGRHIPMIFFITSSADERARTLAVELGAVNFLDKASGNKALLKEICLILEPRDREKEERTRFNSPRS